MELVFLLDTRATELIVAVRAIIMFFSLILVLFGIMNMLYGMLAAFTLVSLCYVIPLKGIVFEKLTK